MVRPRRGRLSSYGPEEVGDLSWIVTHLKTHSREPRYPVRHTKEGLPNTATERRVTKHQIRESIIKVQRGRSRLFPGQTEP